MGGVGAKGGHVREPIDWFEVMAEADFRSGGFARPNSIGRDDFHSRLNLRYAPFLLRVSPKIQTSPSLCEKYTRLLNGSGQRKQGDA